MSFLSEAEIEQAFLEQLRELGYAVTFSKVIDKETRGRLAPIIQLGEFEFVLSNLEGCYR